MNSRALNQVIRGPLARQLAAAAGKTTQRRGLSAVAAATARPVVRAAALSSPGAQQMRGVKTVDFAGVKEDVFGECSWTSGAAETVLTGCRARRLAA
jgi:ketol-acid reductoisomerase